MGDLFAADDTNDIKFTINKNYAEKYSEWRSKEFLQHCKDMKRKREYDSSEESSSEDDEDAKDLEHYEKDFFQTMAWLKTKDPNKYDNNKEFFSEPSTSKSNKGAKPFLLRDYQRNFIIENHGRGDDEKVPEQDPRAHSPTYVQEQKAFRESFKQALEDSDVEEEEKDIGSLFKKKGGVELQEEEENCKEWLKGRQKTLKDKNTATELKNLHDFWSNPKLSSEDAFLRDYILNQKFLDPEDEDYRPAYNEVVHDSCDLDVEEKNLMEMDDFERKYNFRFEEPDQQFIKRFPRSSESFRRKDNRRALKRQEVMERKKAEKVAKMGEIKQLKAIKRKEILAKIEKIKEVTGNDIDIQDDDLEDDFDPEKHDQKMSELFSDGYYQVEEKVKPECPEIDRDLEIENWEKWQGKDAEDELYNGYTGDNKYAGGQPECEAPDFNMDCDYDPKAQLQDELINMTKGKRKLKKKSRFAAAIAREKPVFDPNDKKFEEYYNEYYKLDCEDIIGDLPCRFKYRQTTPNGYGLTVDEILRADVNELNTWYSLKKIVKYKPERTEKNEVLAYQRKASNETLKRKILPSLYSRNESDGEVDISKEIQNSNDPSKENQNTNDKPKKKCRRKMKKNFKRAENDTSKENQNSTDTSKENQNSNDPSKENENTNDKPKKKCRRKKKKSLNGAENDTSKVNQTSNVAPKEIQNSNNTSKENQNSNNTSKENQNTNDKPKKKCRRKKKKSLNGAENGASKKLQSSVVSKAKSGNQRKRKFKESEDFPISDDRLKAYGVRPKIFKNKLKWKK